MMFEMTEITNPYLKDLSLKSEGKFHFYIEELQRCLNKTNSNETFKINHSELIKSPDLQRETIYFSVPDSDGLNMNIMNIMVNIYPNMKGDFQIHLNNTLTTYRDIYTFNHQIIKHIKPC